MEPVQRDLAMTRWTVSSSPSYINIVDVSRLESGAYGRNLVVSIIAQKPIQARSDARLERNLVWPGLFQSLADAG